MFCALTEGLAFTWSPKSKSAVLKSIMRRLRITEMVLPKTDIRIYLIAAGLKKNLIPLRKEYATFSA